MKKMSILALSIISITPLSTYSKMSKEAMFGTGGIMAALGFGAWAIYERIHKHKINKELSDYKSKKIERDEAQAFLSAVARSIERATTFAQVQRRTDIKMVNYLKGLLEQEQISYASLLARCCEDRAVLERAQAELSLKSATWRTTLPALHGRAEELIPQIQRALSQMNDTVTTVRSHGSYLRLIELHREIKVSMYREIALGNLIYTNDRYQVPLQNRVKEATVRLNTPFKITAYLQQVGQLYEKLQRALTELGAHQAYEPFQREYIAQVITDGRALERVMDTLLNTPEYAREIKEKPLYEAEERRKQELFEHKQRLERAEEDRKRTEYEWKRAEERRKQEEARQKREIYDLECQRIAAQIEDSRRMADAALQAHQQTLYQPSAPAKMQAVPSAPPLEQYTSGEAPPSYDELSH